MLLSKNVKGLSEDENVCVGAVNFLNIFIYRYTGRLQTANFAL